jgi:hypothetical protein
LVGPYNKLRDGASGHLFQRFDALRIQVSKEEQKVAPDSLDRGWLVMGGAEAFRVFFKYFGETASTGLVVLLAKIQPEFLLITEMESVLKARKGFFWLTAVGAFNLSRAGAVYLLLALRAAKELAAKVVIHSGRHRLTAAGPVAGFLSHTDADGFSVDLEDPAPAGWLGADKMFLTGTVFESRKRFAADFAMLFAGGRS